MTGAQEVRVAVNQDHTLSSSLDDRLKFYLKKNKKERKKEKTEREEREERERENSRFSSHSCNSQFHLANMASP